MDLCVLFLSFSRYPGTQGILAASLGTAQKEEKSRCFGSRSRPDFDTLKAPQSFRRSKESSHIGCGLRGRSVRSAPEVYSYNCELDVNLVFDFGCFWGFSGFWDVFLCVLEKKGAPRFMVLPVLRDIKDIHVDLLPLDIKLCSINEVMRGSRIGKLAGQRQRKSCLPTVRCRWLP